MRAIVLLALGLASCSGETPLGPAPAAPPEIFVSAPIPPIYPVPSPQQLAYQRMEMNAFVHFGPNTFTGVEWGDGTTSPEVFAPTDLDATQ